MRLDLVNGLISAAALAFVCITPPTDPPPEPLPEPGGTAEPTERGEALFLLRCADCHSGAIAPAAADLGGLDSATFGKKVNEHPEVGAFEGLTAQDVNEIYNWLRTQARD